MSMNLPDIESVHSILCVIVNVEGHNEKLDIALGNITVVQGGCEKCLETAFTELLVRSPELRTLVNAAGKRANEIRREQRGNTNKLT